MKLETAAWRSSGAERREPKAKARGEALRTDDDVRRNSAVMQDKARVRARPHISGKAG